MHLVSIRQDILLKAVNCLSCRVPFIPGLTRVTARNEVGLTVYVRLIYSADAGLTTAFVGVGLNG
jgi:hypothetical protein